MVECHAAQLHWVGAHMRLGESLVAQAALNSKTRARPAVLEAQGAPGRVRKVERMIELGEVRDALENIMPSELFLIAVAAEERRR
jgi:hypothetical protein